MGDASWLKRRLYRFWMAQGRRIARRRLGGSALGIGDRLLQAAGWVLLYRALRDRLGLSRVRMAASGAAPIAPQVLEYFWALGLPILIPVLFAGWLFATYMLTRTIYRTVLEGRDRELRALADAVATVAGEVALPAGAAQPELPSASGTGAA